MHLWQIQFHRIFNRDDPFVIWNMPRKNVEERRLARAGISSHDHIQARLYADCDKVSHGLGECALVDQILNCQLVFHEAANGQTRSLLSNGWYDGIDTGAILE